MSETRQNSSHTTTAQTTFGYDPAGNRLIQQITINPLAGAGGQTSTVNYTYNSLDQLQTVNSTQYHYDGRGNLTTVDSGPSAITHYAYDAADRLIQVTKPDGTGVTNHYDVDGWRVQQTVGTQTTHYLWDEASQFGDVVLATTGSYSG